MLDALLGPFLDPGSRTFWGGLVVALVVAVGVRVAGGQASLAGLVRALGHRSTALDLQLYVGRRLLGLALAGTSTLGGFWVATRAVRWLDAAVGRPELAVAEPVVVAAYALTLFVAWDLSRFLVHLAMHRVPALWALHQVHHSAEVLTPLTFHRLHPLESLVYQLRGLVVTSAVATAFFWLFRDAAHDWTLLGVHGIGFVLNTATGNLRHSEVWLRFGPVERWLISPAQHQIHHAADPALFDRNFGTWLAVWDRLAGTLALAGPEPVAAFGIPAAERNHGDDLFSAWFGPLRQLLGGRAAQLAPLALVLATAAHAEPAADALPEGFVPEEGEAPVTEPGFVPETAEEGSSSEAPAAAAEPEPVAEPDPVAEPEAIDWDAGEDILVYAEDGTPRVAGSAHQIGEAQLEQYEYDDIERVVAAVPGVTTRGEDGFGLRPNIGIRGVNSDRSAKITLLEDGVPLVPAPYAAPAAYYFPMSTRLVGVEVFKGPAATTHGPHTVGGAINLKTRDIPNGVDGALDLAAGMRGTFKAHAWTGAGDGDKGVLLEVVRLQTRGFKQLDGGGPTGFDRTEAMLKTAVSARGDQANHRLELKLGYAHEHSDETYLGLSLSDYQDNPYRRYAASQLGLMRWHRTQAELSFASDFGAVSLRTVAYHHYLTRQWTKLNRFAGGPDLHDLLQADPTGGSAAVYMAILRGEADSETAEQTVMIGTNDRRFHAFGIQTTGKWELRGDGFESTLRFGARLHGDRVHRVHTEDPHAMRSGTLEALDAPTETLLDSFSSADALALHVQEDLGVGRVHVLPGTRAEIIQTSRIDGDEHKPELVRVAVLPGVGVLAELGAGLDVYAGAHRGFSPVAPGQPEEVRPEVSWNYELGARASRGDLVGELTGFVNDYVNLTGQCTISGGCDGDLLDLQFNGGKVLVAGAEAVARQTWRLPNGWSIPVDGTYTYTWSRFRTSFVSGFPQFGSVTAGDSLPYVPEHAGSARVGLSSERFRVGVGASARGGMRDQAGSGPLSDADVPALFLLDAAVEGQVSKHLALYATGTNLTASKALTSWRPFGARPTAPLQVMVGIKLAPPYDG